MKRMSLLLFLALFTACGSSSEDSDKPKPGAIAFVADTPKAGPSVTLELAELTDSELSVELVAHDVDKLYGVAFRIAIDPEVLQFQNMQASDVWSQFSQTIARAEPGSPATLVGVITGKGKQPGFAADGVVLATLTFARKSAAATRVELQAVPSALVSVDGRAIPGVSWYGGSLQKE